MIRILKLSALLVFALASLAFTEKTRYDNYRLVRVIMKNQAHADLIEKWDGNNDFDLWAVDRVNLTYADVFLSPAAFAKYSALFKANDMNFVIGQNNFQDVLDEEERQLAKSRLNRASIVGKFASYAEIQSFIENTVASHPDIASTYLAGKSLEGRDLRVIVLKTKTSSKKIWIDCGIHAREWVSHPTCIFAIDQLISTDRKLLDTYEFHILPLVNPDGYEFTKTTRMHRKNTRVNAGSTCKGVDLNRNFDFEWMKGGASSDPCQETYAGTAPDSEPETRAVVSAINAHKGEWAAFFTIHSYGQYWLISFGHHTVQADDHNEMLRVATAGVNGIKNAGTGGTVFKAGQSSTMLYITTGSSQDWAKGVAGIKYSYTLELRPQQGSLEGILYGFALPESQVPNINKETYAGIKAAIAALP